MSIGSDPLRLVPNPQADEPGSPGGKAGRVEENVPEK